MDYFYNVFINFFKLEKFGQISMNEYIKYLLLCSQDKPKSYRSEKHDDRFLIFGRTVPLNVTQDNSNHQIQFQGYRDTANTDIEAHTQPSLGLIIQRS